MGTLKLSGKAMLPQRIYSTCVTEVEKWVISVIYVLAGMIGWASVTHHIGVLTRIKLMSIGNSGKTQEILRKTGVFAILSRKFLSIFLLDHS